jgi:dethiobiotin synthetase
MFPARCSISTAESGETIMTKGVFITGQTRGQRPMGRWHCALSEKHIDLVMKPLKPVFQTAGRLVPKDARRLMTAAGSRDALALVNPYRFRKPLAPSIAAELEHASMSISTIVKAYRSLSKKHDFMIVEGAGGILVPLTTECTFLDLAEKLGLPVVVVARPTRYDQSYASDDLGAQGRGVVIAGVVINYARNQKGIIEDRTRGYREYVRRPDIGNDTVSFR